MDSAGFLERNGNAAVFGLVFLHQLGVPFPCEILLIAAGALGARGGLSLPVAFAGAVVASLLADFAWYEIGRRRGAQVLGFLCRMSLEPDSCVRSTETLFERRGSAILVVAKFVPGLSTVAPPLAGLLRVGVPRFLLLDLAGSVLWVGAFLGIGVVFSRQVETVTTTVEELGAPMGWAALAIVAAYLGAKFASRQLFLRRLRTARIAPAEVHRLLGAGEPLFIVDLRNPLDHAGDPRTLPGAQRITPEELTLHHERIPRDRDIVLYCT